MRHIVFGDASSIDRHRHGNTNYRPILGSRLGLPGAQWISMCEAMPQMTERHQPRVLVGTCGFAEAQRKLLAEFGVLEIQKTFYQPPRVTTAARWRALAPPGFVFTLKAWQLITHEAPSPTYRRLTEQLSANQLKCVGAFKWNPTTRMAWQRTREIADALGASAIVFQTPKRFRPSRENLDQLWGFFQRIERDDRRMVFEPRGEAWTHEILRPLIQELNLVHAVDPFLCKPVGRGLRYFRLHGRPAYHYHYRYSAQDLDQLTQMLSGAWPNWVLFNNDAMADDARRFLRRLG